MYAFMYSSYIFASSYNVVFQAQSYGASHVILTGNRFEVMLMVILSGTFAAATASLGLMHIFLVSLNVTTLEGLSSPFRSAYSSGCFNNFRTVFGESPWLWPVPFLSVKTGDGCEFEVYQ